MQEEEEDAHTEPEVNIAAAGRMSRDVDAGSTLAHVTLLELVALVNKRQEQLNDHENPHGAIAPAVQERLGREAGQTQQILAELMDAEVDFPVLVPRGTGETATHLRVHKDLELHQHVVDAFVLGDEAGRVSYNTVAHDIQVRPHAPTISMERDIQRRAELLENLQGVHL